MKMMKTTTTTFLQVEGTREQEEKEKKEMNSMTIMISMDKIFLVQAVVAAAVTVAVMMTTR